MLVEALKPHNNCFGDIFEKPKGYEYEHPDPDGDIAAKVVAPSDGLASKPVAELKTLAREAGVLPTSGSGKNEAVIKADVLEALRRAPHD